MNPGVTDGLQRLESKVAFLSLAVLAISIAGPEQAPMNKKECEGLFFWALDLEQQTRELNELAHQG